MVKRLDDSLPEFSVPGIQYNEGNNSVTLDVANTKYKTVILMTHGTIEPRYGFNIAVSLDTETENKAHAMLDQILDAIYGLKPHCVAEVKVDFCKL